MGMDWQVTATTLFCNEVADEVTLLVYPDWSVKCTGMEKFAVSSGSGTQQLKKMFAAKKNADCKGTNCPDMSRYLEKLKNEERNKSTQSRSSS